MKDKFKSYYELFTTTCGKYASNIAIRQYEDSGYKTYTYSELYGICEYIAQTLIHYQIQKSVIGIICEKNPFVTSVLAAVHKNSPTFVFLDPKADNSQLFVELKLEALISVTSNKGDDCLCSIEHKPLKELSIFDHTFRIYKLECICGSECPSESKSDTLSEHSYIALTSGSTGASKHVLVPIKCLEPNIRDLIKLFNLSESDVIYFSTPLTFDPSMVEILLACQTGASLLIAPYDIDILFSFCGCSANAITFWQTTPSKFFQFNDDEITLVLNATSHLKVLAFGGEPMNQVSRLKKFKSASNKTKIFCMYGVTEMSCWATITEVHLNKINDGKEIPLGDCMSETRLELSQIKPNVGKILLGSKTRKCHILNSSNKCQMKKRDDEQWVDTGDLGYLKNETIYFHGRSDDIIKRFGNKVNLKNIEEIALMHPFVKSCSCIWLPKVSLLILYYASDNLQCDELQTYLRSGLTSLQRPDKYVRVSSMPLTTNGKADKSKLAAQPASAYNPSDDIIKMFKETIEKTLPQEVKFNKISNKSFIDAGGDSFMAVTVCNHIGMQFPYLGNCVLTSLLSRTETLQEIMEKLRVEATNRSNFGSAPKTLKRHLQDLKSKSMKTGRFDPSIRLKIIWSRNLEKCVDASPTFYEHSNMSYVVIGSHAGKISVLNSLNGHEIGTLALSSRIEASALCFQIASKPVALLGTYDGTVVCFSLTDCTTIWTTKFPSMIKSRACIIKDKVYIALYDGSVRCVDFMTGARKHIHRISKLGIRADLLAYNDDVIVCTLNGVCASIDAKHNLFKWRQTLDSPIFAAPVIFDKNRLLVAEVQGVVHCFNADCGTELWRFNESFGQNIYSSFAVRPREDNTFQIYFGCHDKHLYSLKVKGSNMSLLWKRELSSELFATPALNNNRSVIACTSDGKVQVFNCDKGRPLCELTLPGQVFSSPTVHDRLVYVGCRDDYIYCLNFVED